PMVRLLAGGKGFRSWGTCGVWWEVAGSGGYGIYRDGRKMG
nr:hypothetical protein [Tanacetum cinerariifolium]